MKKIVAWIGCMLLMVSVVCAKDRVTRDENQLPVGARDMIKTYFPGASVSYVKIDKNLFRTEGYDVRLSDGTELEFNPKGGWNEVSSGKTHAIPQKLIPESIQHYMQKNYANHRIIKIKHNRRGYELKLDNGLEVEFDNMGKFLRLDD